MGLHIDLPDAVPGNRAANLAVSAATHPQNNAGVVLAVYLKLCALMCWDAALYCAWAASSINSTSISQAAGAFGVVQNNGLSYAAIFGVDPLTRRSVDSAAKLMLLPKGAFVGFVNLQDQNRLRHVMIHTGNGWGCGNKNDCVLSAGHTTGWERLDMAAFFLKDAQYNGNGNTRMIYFPVQGQTI